MCARVWDKPCVDEADKAFDKALERAEATWKVRLELREIFEKAVNAAPSSSLTPPTENALDSGQ